MQAIITKYLPPTNFRGSRIKASCERGSITVEYDHSKGCEGAHIAAVDALVSKFVEEDKERYGSESNPWARPRVVGGLPGSGYVHVSSDWNQTVVVKFENQEDFDHFKGFVKRAKESGGTPAPLWCGIAASALKRAKI